jgi:hypothetical protein
VLAQRVERHRRAAAQVGEGVRDDAVEHVRLVAQLPRRLRDRPLGRRRQLAQCVQHLVSHARTREAAVGVRRVLAPFEAARPQVVAHLGAGHREQRAHQPPAPRRHPVDRARARRYRQAVQHRLRLVGGRVGRGVIALGELLGECVTDVSRPLLQIALPAHIRAPDRDGHVKRRAQVAHEVLVRVRVVTEPVVHVEGGHPGVQAVCDVQERHRVAPA